MRGKTIALGLSLCAFIALAAQPSFAARPSQRIHAGAGWGDCVRTVRALSDFTIRGDAWTWWGNAAGEYARDSRPAAGSVLVFKRTSNLGRGHVSLVSRVLDNRNVLVDHTWIAGRGIKRGMQVTDVSAHNDWSAVRVWHGPTDQLGQRVYPTYGFILPEKAKPWGDVLQVADRGDAGQTVESIEEAAPLAVTPGARRAIRRAKAPDAPAFGRMFSAASASALMSPPRKPLAPAARAVAGKPGAPAALAVALTGKPVVALTGKPVKVADAAKTAARKPATRVSVKKPVMPARKPKAA